MHVWSAPRIFTVEFHAAVIAEAYFQYKYLCGRKRGCAELVEILFALVGLLFATVIVVAIGERTGLPWPALLTLLAAVAIFVPGVPEISVPPEFILPIFIPPLLWALARRTSWSSVRRNWRAVLLLSIGLTVVTAFVVGLSAAVLVPTLSLAGALMIGAAISPPDPVAVDAVAEPAGVPRRISNTLATEGLFNDAASIVVFNLALGVLTSGKEITWTDAIGTFFYSAGIAVAIGYAMGRFSAAINNWATVSVARNALTWGIPFATFLLAEHFHASGVIAIVIAAVEYNSRIELGAEDRLSGSAFWEVVELLFTGAAFGLIGLQVRTAIEQVGRDLWHAVWIGVALSVVAIAVRGAWLYVMYVGYRRIGRRNGSPLRLQEVLLLTWAGMRGLVTLALVLSIPPTIGFGLYHELSVVALVVLMLTMVIPGLTLPWLMRKLSLNEGPDPFGDIAREELLKRSKKAAEVVVKKNQDLLPEEMQRVIRHRIFDGMQLAENDTAGDTAEEKNERIQKTIAEMNRIHLEALSAAERELLNARRENGTDPAIVDELLEELSSKIVVTKRRMRK